MPANAKPSVAQKALISQLLADDVELREIARAYVLVGMRETLDQLMRGDPATRAAIARGLSGVLTKAITEATDEDTDQTLRAEMHEMMAEMRADIAAQDEPAKPTVVPKK